MCSCKSRFHLLESDDLTNTMIGLIAKVLFLYLRKTKVFETLSNMAVTAAPVHYHRNKSRDICIFQIKYLYLINDTDV